MYNILNRCLVCGYEMGLEIYDEKGELQSDAFYLFCPSCGFEYAVTDTDKGYTFQAWRKIWIDGGMNWSSKITKMPKDWIPKNQLKNINVILDNEGMIIEDQIDPKWHIGFKLN